MKEELQTAAFQIIATVGEAKSLYVEAMYAARESDFETAEAKLEEGSKVYSQAHTFHFDLVQKEANGEDLPFSILFMHAEDQMLTTETVKIMAEEIVHLRKDMVK